MNINFLNIELIENPFSIENIHFEYHNELALDDLWIDFDTNYDKAVIPSSIQ